MAFHRGSGRGGGGGVQRGGPHGGPPSSGGPPPHPQSFRGRGAGRGGFQPGRLEPAKEKLKFDGDYDFDKANEEFKVRSISSDNLLPSVIFLDGSSCYTYDFS
jgi:hypothetical protein